MTIKSESNPFEIFLNTLVQDFGGLGIFDEENESRLNKAVKSLADSFAQEKKWMQIACMENIPQKLYSVIEFPKEAQQRMIDNCLKELSSLGLTPQVCENVISSFISVLKLKGSATKMPEIEKIMGEMELDGEIYKTCKIGNQIWMAENLRCSKLLGDEMGMALPAYKYGRLYTHYGAQRFYDGCKCLLKKEGWRLPTIEDWLKMVSYIESLGFDAGTALKSVGDWDGNADSGLDLFGFGAHPIKYWDDNLPQKEALKTIDDIKIWNDFNFTTRRALKTINDIKIWNDFSVYESLKDIAYEIGYKEWPEEDNRIKSEKKKKLDEVNSIINQYNTFVEMSTPVFPCVQFWTSTKYVDNPCVDEDTEMAYVATLGDFNKVDLDGGKLSCSGRAYSPYIPFGFACVRFVKYAD